MEAPALLSDLNGRLGFIGRFYLKAVRPFETTQREIVRQKEAFLSRGENAADSSIEEDWSESTKCVQVLGQCCLGLLEKALHDYLRGFVEREGGVEKRSGNWFERYSDFLTKNTSFEWARSPVTYGQIEQINLSRNDCWHDPGIDDKQPAQSQKHFEKHPHSRFSDALERAIRTAMDGREPDFPISLRVTKQGLFSALGDVARFCEFVETHKRSQERQ
ncbi:MAG: hypothetical protein ABSC23_13670 [Bryobacteraceae bacterium]|jgi:hypothetical protein